MRRLLWPRTIAGVVALLLAVTLTVSCRTNVYVEPHVQETAYPSYPTARPASPTPRPEPTKIPPTPTPAPVAFSMTILHTSEVAGEIVPCGWKPPKGGLARRASAIAQVREASEETVLLLDAGDVLFGKPESNQSQGGLQIAAMNALGYDAMALGSVDLGAKASALTERFQEANFPILSSNVGPTGILPLQPYTLFEIEGHTVAIVGATAVRARDAASTLGVELAVEDGPTAVGRIVEEIRTQADVIIVLSNLTINTNTKIAETVPGVDVIIGTRDGGNPNGAQLVQGPEGKVVMHSAGRQGQYLGMLTLHFDAEGQIEVYEGKGLLLTDTYADDPDMVALLKEYGVNP